MRTECPVRSWYITLLSVCSDVVFFTSRNAMDNASKNASDMISSLQMKYNRGRQAAITNELVDIITGSSFSFLAPCKHFADLSS